MPEGIERFFPVPPSSSGLLAVPTEVVTGTGLPADILLPILESLRDDVTEIRDTLANIHLRMVGASLLIVYEADTSKAREGVKFWLEGEGEMDEEDEEDDDDDDDDEQSKKPGIPYSVKLIDFAHTCLVPGEGPDEGVLLGLSTVLRLLDGRIGAVRSMT